MYFWGTSHSEQQHEPEGSCKTRTVYAARVCEFCLEISISCNIRLRAIDIGQEWQKRNQKAFTEDILCKFIGAGR